MDKPKIILPFVTACADHLYDAIPLYLDTFIPQSLKEIPYLTRLPYCRLAKPKPDSEDYIKSGVLFDGYELELDCYALLDRKWNIIPGCLEKFKTFNFPILSVHGILSKGLVKRKYLSLRLDDLDEDLVYKAIKNQLRITKDLNRYGKSILVLHSGELYKPSQTQIETSLKQLIKNLKNIKPVLAKEKVYIVLENTYNIKDYIDPNSSAKNLQRMLAEVSSPYLKINLDWGHLNAQARQEYLERRIMKSDLRELNFHREFIRTLKGQIMYAHLHYNDCHLQKQIKINGRHITMKEIRKLDQHRPLNHFDKKSFPEFQIIMQEMIRDNPIEKICLEVLPKKVLKVVNYFKYGGEKADILESVKMLREMISANA